MNKPALPLPVEDYRTASDNARRSLATLKQWSYVFIAMPLVAYAYSFTIMAPEVCFTSVLFVLVSGTGFPAVAEIHDPDTDIRRSAIILSAPGMVAFTGSDIGMIDQRHIGLGVTPIVAGLMAGFKLYRIVVSLERAIRNAQTLSDKEVFALDKLFQNRPVSCDYRNAVQRAGRPPCSRAITWR